MVLWMGWDGMLMSMVDAQVRLDDAFGTLWHGFTVSRELQFHRQNYGGVSHNGQRSGI